jgi:competence protein ComEC
LLTGDIENVAERDIISMGYNISCDVLKAPHHGSETSSSYIFLREANPRIVVISCGKDNTYGHPHDGPLSRYYDLGATVYRTDIESTIVLTSDGKTITSNAEGSKSDREYIPVNDPENDGVIEGDTVIVNEYIGNVNSKKFHLPSCTSLPIEKNRVIFGNREDAVTSGYAPCKICNP